MSQAPIGRAQDRETRFDRAVAVHAIAAVFAAGVCATKRASDRGARSTKNTPSVNRGSSSAATRSASRVFPVHVLASDDGRVVGIHHNSAQRNGKRLDVGCCIVFQVKDGRIVSGREHFYDLYAWDEFWA